MTVLRIALLSMVTAFLAGGCTRGRVKPSGETLTVCLSRFSAQSLSTQAARVKELRRRGPVLWLVQGNPFADAWMTAATDGAGVVQLLSAAGVDAVLVSPDWLSFGIRRQHELVNSARCYVLGANLQDSTGQPFGHQFMVRRLGRTEVALTGLWTDSNDIRLRLDGARYVSPGFAVRRTGTLMRQRADVVGVLVPDADTVAGWGMDFVAGGFSGSTVSLPSGTGMGLARYDLRLLDGRVTGVSVLVRDTVRVEPDSAVTAAVGVLESRLDSLGSLKEVELGRQMSAPDLFRAVVRGWLATKAADGFLYDSLPVRYSAGPGTVSRRNLVNLLRAPGRLALLSLTGEQVKAFPKTSGLAVELRTGLPKTLPSDRTYVIAATGEFLLRHPEFAAGGFRLTDKQFWTIAAEALQSPTRR